MMKQDKEEWIALIFDDENVWGETKEEVIKKAKEYIKQCTYIPYGYDDDQEDTTQVTIVKVETHLRAEKRNGKIKFIYSKLPDSASEDAEEDEQEE